jgi:hypothetical protein
MFLYLKSNNYEEVKFGLFSLKEFFSKSDNLLIKENIDIIYNIFECMNKYINDKIILYHGLWIISNYIFFSKNNEKNNDILTSKEFFKIYEYILSTNDTDLFCLILYLFHNITSLENNEKKHNEVNYKILISNLFKNRILKFLMEKEFMYHIDDDNGIYKDILFQGFHFFSNLMATEKENIDNIQKLEIKQIKQQMLKILLKFIDTKIEVIYEAILYNIIIFYDYIDDQFPSKIISLKVIEKVLNNNNFHSNYPILILTNRVIGNFLSMNDIFDLELIDKIFNFEFNILLNGKISEEKIDVFWTLGNLISCSDTMSDLLMKKENFIELIIKILKEDYDKVEIRELLITLGKIISTVNFDNYVYLAKIGVFDELICATLKFEKDEDLLPFIFQNLSFFIEKAELIKHFTENKNIVLNKFNEKGGKELLMKYQYSKNDLLRNVVEQIFNKFYQNNNDNNFNIEIE